MPLNEGRAELGRRAFIFSYFTGLAYADIKQLRPCHIGTTAEGRRFIRISRKKTGVEAFIPLHPIAEQILALHRVPGAGIVAQRALEDGAALGDRLGALVLLPELAQLLGLFEEAFGQAELDLHGLNRDEARQQLATFLAECLHHGRRCVRVIHGKGHGSPQKLSILRQLVRGWLAQRQETLAYCQALPHDGGEGALIVLLRASKK